MQRELSWWGGAACVAVGVMLLATAVHFQMPSPNRPPDGGALWTTEPFNFLFGPLFLLVGARLLRRWR